ncbi:hypothetical protein BJP37_05940 [Moorena bouillonii PNG]|uniref:Uncharacterized protein n=1 Tax=Moorena bouillonii PNG TaxID=568701 RepID=A0A1U7MY72_9CYAN|nr:hypothetical protein BJP37_05940 [Moorena bouillonii PNG]
MFDAINYSNLGSRVFFLGLDPPKSPLIRGTFQIDFQTPPNNQAFEIDFPTSYNNQVWIPLNPP